jgi:predicted methyltransferase
VFKSLKPGGAYVIVDHSAKAGAEVVPTASGIHRIDPAVLRREVEAAGFRYAGELNILRAPADPLTASVFDPSIRGKTDQFAYKFLKPR